ncbi:hypothetical protein C5167_035488 [Papaver somniferum]|uniref:mRNA export factor GLE1 n=2 Tax=Papaver somniferum TaxID=3469 RepID=A0A4Y7KIY9_PAPSO|nr:hypothetical protein C5167_035488 [Papaver somniferum]
MQRGFVMRVPDYSSDSETSGDDDDDDSVIKENQTRLMGRVGLLDGVLAELEHELCHQGTKEKIRNKVKKLQTDLMHEYERSASLLSQLEKDGDYERELDRQSDMQHCRAIAEERENHLLAVHRERELQSRIEERKITNALEEARREEQVLREERLQKENLAHEQKIKNAAAAALEEARRKEEVRLLKLKEQALREERLQKFKEQALREDRLLKEIDEKIQAFRSISSQAFRDQELQIGRRIRQISGSRDSVIAKASELITLLNDPLLCPQSISAAIFAKKIVSQCSNQRANFNGTAFAYGYVIVFVTSQVPLAMDLLLAELHKACIYTDPMHLVCSKPAAISKEDCFKMTGFREEDWNAAESLESYLEGVASYIKLYGALVQTEVRGVKTLHGLKEGWAWVARLLNSLEPDIYTAVALYSFLEMAGFALFRAYKTQFQKMLNFISGRFVDALESKQDPDLKPVIVQLETYIDTNQFLKEPEGRHLKTCLLSEMAMPEENYRPQQRRQYYTG